MVFEEITKDLYIAVHQPIPVPDHEWQDLRDAVADAASRGATLKILVRAEGEGGPNVKQRAEVAEALSSGAMRISVLTHGVVIKGIVTALRWLKGVDARAFAPTDWSQALAHLQAGPEGDKALARLLQVQDELRAARRQA